MMYISAIDFWYHLTVLNSVHLLVPHKILISNFLKIYSLVGKYKNDFVKYFMQHIRNGLFINLINS